LDDVADHISLSWQEDRQLKDSLGLHSADEPAEEEDMLAGAQGNLVQHGEEGEEADRLQKVVEEEVLKYYLDVRRDETIRNVQGSA